jgi:hypothetical protein
MSAGEPNAGVLSIAAGRDRAAQFAAGPPHLVPGRHRLADPRRRPARHRARSWAIAAASGGVMALALLEVLRMLAELSAALKLKG